MQSGHRKFGEAGTLRRALPLLVLAALVLGFFTPVWLRGETFFALDNLLDYLPWSTEHPGFRAENPMILDPVNGLIYPTMSLFQQGLEQGTLALWNPFALLGIPQLPQSNPLDYLAYGLLSIPAAHDLLLALYLTATLGLTFALLRELSLGPLPALLGSVAWGFNPYAMVWFEFEHAPLLAATLPAMLLCVERWLRTRQPAALLGLTTAAAFSLYADNVQLTVYEWLLVGSFTALRLTGKARRSEVGGPATFGARALVVLRRDATPLAIAFGAAALAAANVVTGGFYALEGAQRESLGFAELYHGTAALPGEYLRTLFFPDFYGTPLERIFLTPRPGPGYPSNNYNELCIYAGVVPLLLAAASLAWIRRAEVAFFAAVGAFCLLSAAGSVAYLPIATLFPGLDLAAPARILYVWGFCVSLLAAFGLEHLLAEEGRRVGSLLPGRRLGAALGAVAVLVAAGFAIAWQVQSDAGIAGAFRRAVASDALAPLLPLLRAHLALAGPTLARPLVQATACLCLVASLVVLQRPGARSACGIALIALVVSDLVTFGARYNTTTSRDLAFPETPAIRFLLEDDSLFRVVGFGTFLHNGLAPFAIQETGGYSSFFPKRTAEMLLAADLPATVSSSTAFGLDIAPPGGTRSHASYALADSPLLDVLNVTYLLVPPGTRPPTAKRGPDPGARDRFELVYDGEIRIFRNHGAFARAFFVPRYELVEDPIAAYRAVDLWRADDFRERVLLEQPPPEAFRELQLSDERGGQMGTGTRDADESPAPVRVVSYGVNRVELDVETTRQGFVVVSDAWHPAWRATLNGEPTEVLRANYALRAVAVSPGRTRIVLEIAPRSVQLGAAITAGGWVALGLAWAGLALRGARAKNG